MSSSIVVPKGTLDLERLECQLDLTYNWGYAETRKDLRDLYRKAKRSQWNSDDQLSWNTTSISTRRTCRRCSTRSTGRRSTAN